MRNGAVRSPVPPRVGSRVRGVQFQQGEAVRRCEILPDAARGGGWRPHRLSVGATGRSPRMLGGGRPAKHGAGREGFRVDLPQERRLRRFCGVVRPHELGDGDDAPPARPQPRGRARGGGDPARQRSELPLGGIPELARRAAHVRDALPRPFAGPGDSRNTLGADRAPLGARLHALRGVAPRRQQHGCEPRHVAPLRAAHLPHTSAGVLALARALPAAPRPPRDREAWRAYPVVAVLD